MKKIFYSVVFFICLSGFAQTVQDWSKKSTESFLLKKVNGSYTVLYHGAVDDNPQVQSDVSRAYLKENIDNILANRMATTGNTMRVGCTM